MSNEPAPLGEGISDENIAKIVAMLKERGEKTLGAIGHLMDPKEVPLETLAASIIEQQSRRLSSGRDRNATIEELREALESILRNYVAALTASGAEIDQRSVLKARAALAALKTTNGDKPPSPAGEQPESVRERRLGWAFQLTNAADQFSLNEHERHALRELANAIEEDRP